MPGSLFYKYYSPYRVPGNIVGGSYCKTMEEKKAVRYNNEKKRVCYNQATQKKYRLAGFETMDFNNGNCISSHPSRERNKSNSILTFAIT
jgi:hypothetical protein